LESEQSAQHREAKRAASEGWLMPRILFIPPSHLNTFAVRRHVALAADGYAH
jgi:hypothetical protein